jgi:hypothetical protein
MPEEAGEERAMLNQIMLNCLNRAKDWEDYFYIGINMRRYRRKNLRWR